MQPIAFINYLLASFISLLGLGVGIVLLKIAPEEKKMLEKNFSLARKILLLMIFIASIVYFYYSGKYHYLILVLAGLLIQLYCESNINKLSGKSAINYASYGVIFFLSSGNLSFFALICSLIFLYGMATGSMLYNRKGASFFRIFSYNSVFLATANLIYLGLDIFIN